MKKIKNLFQTTDIEKYYKVFISRAFNKV